MPSLYGREESNPRTTSVAVGRMRRWIVAPVDRMCTSNPFWFLSMQVVSDIDLELLKVNNMAVKVIIKDVIMIIGFL